jgi:RNA polymerase sigma-70 factor, ECF subfamily
MDEQEAVRRCQDGDRDAFHQLVEQYQNVLMGTAYLMTRDRAVAEELVQDAFLSAWRGIAGFRLGEPVKPWLVRITVNTVISHQRRHSLPTVPIPDVAEPGKEDPAVQRAEDRDAIQRGLTVLASEQRQAVVLRYFADMTVPEVAEALGWPEGTVKSRLHRALEQMREVIGGEGSEGVE